MDHSIVSPVSAAAPSAQPPVPAWRHRRRGRILAAAATLFSARPYPLVSMDEVAEAASMGKATLYRYFPSKEDLYLAVFDQHLDTLDAKLEAAAADGGGASAVLRRLIAILVPALGDHFRGFRTMDEGMIHATERKRRLFRKRRQTIIAHFEQTLRAGMASGEFRPVNAASCAHMLVGMMWSSSANIPDPPEQVAAFVADMFLNGTLATPHAG